MKDLQCKINATNVHEFPNIKLSDKSFHLELNGDALKILFFSENYSLSIL